MSYQDSSIVALKNGQRSSLSPLANGIGMALGGGLNGLQVWTNAWPFQDLMKSSQGWTEFSGTGSYTLTRKDHITNIQGDRILSKQIAVDVQDSTLPMAGVYTVRVTGASANLEYCISNGAPPGFTGWTTASETTWNHTLNLSIILFVRSSDGNPATLSGIEILVPGFVEGQRFRTQWLNFQAAGNMRCFRFMDWLNTNGNIDQEFSERTTIDSLSWSYSREGDTFLHNSDGTVVNCVPIEVCCELCNLLGVDMWINPPTRASLDYAQQEGALISSNLNTSRVIYNEPSNEQWNWSFRDTVRWTTFYYAEKRTATGTPGNNRATATGTPPTEGQQIWPLVHHAAKTRNGGNIDFNTAYRAINVSGQDFDLVTDDGNDTPVNFHVNSSVIYWAPISEASDYQDIEAVNEKGGARAVEIWNAFETGLNGTHTHHRALGVQHTYLELANRKTGVNGSNGQHDFVAVAPYFDFNEEYVPGMTNAQLAALDNTAAANSLVELNSLIAVHPNVICYEWNNHTVPAGMSGGTLQERTDALISYYKSADCVGVWGTFLQGAANAGVKLLCFFVRDVNSPGSSGFWSTQDDWGNALNEKENYIRAQNGFIEAA